MTVGDLGVATDNARGIADLERGLGVSVEHSVQGALDSSVVAWLMSNIYLATQLVVLPGSLIWL